LKVLFRVLFFGALLGGIAWGQGRIYVPALGRFMPQATLAQGGDEPHYVLLTHSLMSGESRDLGPLYTRVMAGGIEAGARFRGATLDHHTILVSRVSGETALWQEVYDFRKPQHCEGSPGCVPFARKGRDPGASLAAAASDTAERAAHPIGFPAIMAALVSLSGARDGEVESAFAFATFLIAGLTMIVTYLLARAVGITEAGAFCAVLLLAPGSAWLVYCKSFYPEPLLGLLVVSATCFFWIGDVTLAGVCTALAIAVKPHFALIPAAWTFVLASRRTQKKDALILGGMTAAAVAGLLLFNRWYTGRAIVAGASGLAWENAPKGLAGWLATFAGSTHGLWVFVPWSVLGLAAITAGLAWSRLRADRPALLALACVVLPFVPVFMTHENPGDCYGPRYWVPFLPVLAVGAVLLARRSGRPGKGLLALLALASMLIAVPGFLMYGWRYNSRPPQQALYALLGRS
jgi:hypothetical protein